MHSTHFEENIHTHFITQVKEYAIFAMDQGGHVTSWNVGAERIKGYREEEIVGKFYGILFTKEDQQTGKPEAELELTKQRGRFEDEGWRRKKDGSLFWASVALTAIYNNKNELIGFTKVTKDLTERKWQEDHLAHKNEELTKTNIDLDNFIYTASHDLKAPVINTEGLVDRLAQLLRKKAIHDGDIEKVIGFIGSSVSRLKSTIEDLTTISRLQRNLTEENNHEWVDVKAVFEDITADFSFLFEEVSCQVTTDFQVNTISFSRKNFRSILYNLLSNAFKYHSSHRGCRIHVQTIREKDRVVLTVKDNGLGISQQNQEKLFTMFKRFHSHVEGSGIGLYIIKRIIENAQGAIEVESVEGEGTQFRVHFKQDA